MFLVDNDWCWCSVYSVVGVLSSSLTALARLSLRYSSAPWLRFLVSPTTQWTLFAVVVLMKFSESSFCALVCVLQRVVWWLAKRIVLPPLQSLARVLWSKVSAPQQQSAEDFVLL
jgi:hypothetical protein